MDKIVITGSQGFIGTVIRETLPNVFPCENVAKRCEDMAWHTGTLIHLAASTSEREAYVNPAKYIDNNVKNLALILTNNNFDKIIFPSSTTVYGKDGSLEPSSVYGITKLACEKLIKVYCKKYWILRIANPYGPGDKKSVFDRLAYCKFHNEVFTIYNDMNVIRDFFPVEHIADVVVNILKGKIAHGIYNVGSGKEFVVFELLKTICEEHNIKYVVTDSPKGISRGYVPTDNLIACTKSDVKNEWIKSAQ